MNKKFEKRRRSSENSHARNKEDLFVIVKTNMRKKDFCLVRKLIGRKISTNEGIFPRLHFFVQKNICKRVQFLVKLQAEEVKFTK